MNHPTTVLLWRAVRLIAAAAALLVLSPATRAANDEEVSPEARALLRSNLNSLLKGRSAERAKAADALGELGAKARSARRALCAAMLDPYPGVRTAAADALKKIDPQMCDLAVSIYVNQDLAVVRSAGELKEDAEPLTPLVVALAQGLESGQLLLQPKPKDPLVTCVVTLSRIAPQDEAANQLLIRLVRFVNPRYDRFYGPGARSASERVRRAAIVNVRDMRHAKQALAQLLWAVQTDSETNRLEAIKSLLTIRDPDNEGVIAKTLAALRFDKSVAVRKAVEQAIEEMKAK
jgi:hypothetical protein